MTMNWYPEIGSSQGKAALWMWPTPGLSLLYNVNLTTPSRGLYTINGRTFSVIGPTLYELLVNNNVVPRGTVANDSKPVSMVGGPTQLLIASGGNTYVYDLVANTLNQLPTGGANQIGTPISMLAYCDGFFIALQANSNKWFVSNALD